MEKPFFITTPIYYVNGEPHIGHAYTTIAADVMARSQRLLGKEVIFSTGTDEHGAKIAEKAKEEDKEPQAFVDGIAREFQDLWEKLNISSDAFIRTTSLEHKQVVQNVLATLFEKGAIYKGVYRGLYCVGCEQFKNPSDLVDGKCPEHDRVAELTEEETYLLKMTELQETLIEKITTREFHIYPSKYEKEILSFLEGEKLEDVSLSRKNVAWGIPLPFDATHTTYVWADAFLNYLSVLGWDGKSEIPHAWPADVQLVGKDILRVHATIWPAMLLHLGLALPKVLYTHGHILSGGKKMSKTLGNSISIQEMLERFGADGTRYLLLASGNFTDDIDITMERLIEKYNADLANGLGNLVSRVMKLAESLDALPAPLETTKENMEENALPQIAETVERAMQLVRNANVYMDETKPWILVKENSEEFTVVMSNLFERLTEIVSVYEALMPETSQKIKTALKTGKTEPLFQRIV